MDVLLKRPPVPGRVGPPSGGMSSRETPPGLPDWTGNLGQSGNTACVSRREALRAPVHLTQQKAGRWTDSEWGPPEWVCWGATVQ